MPLSVRQDRIHRQLAAADRWLRAVLPEAEALADQALADDLHRVAAELHAITEAAKRNRYVSPWPARV